MKNFFKTKLCILILFFIVGCEKDDDTTGSNNNNQNTIEYTESWTIPADNHVMPVADNHKSDILKVFKFGNKEFHFYHIFTNAQHQYYLCRFENDTWCNCTNSPNMMKYAASDQKIGEIVKSSPNSLEDIVSTRFFDPNSESFSSFKSQTFTTKFRNVVIAATNADFYMIAHRQSDSVCMLYKWNDSTEEWEIVIQNIPESEQWSPVVYDVFRSKNEEFIYKNTNNFGVNFYEFKNNEFSRIYRGVNNDIILMRGARLHVINNNYLAIFDKVYNVGSANSLSDYYTPKENYSILQSNVDGNKLILSLGTFSWNGTTSVQKIVVINFSNGKTYELPATANLNGNDWRMSNRYNVDKWQFRINDENKLEGLVHFEYNGNFGQTKLYRVVYPLVLD